LVTYFAVLRRHPADQAADQLKAGDSWRGEKDGYVFTTGWGEQIYTDTVTSLMTKLIRAHNEPAARATPQGPQCFWPDAL
jgi:integrase